MGFDDEELTELTRIEALVNSPDMSFARCTVPPLAAL